MDTTSGRQGPRGLFIMSLVKRAQPASYVRANHLLVSPFTTQSTSSGSGSTSIIHRGVSCERIVLPVNANASCALLSLPSYPVACGRFVPHSNGDRPKTTGDCYSTVLQQALQYYSNDLLLVPSL